MPKYELKKIILKNSKTAIHAFYERKIDILSELIEDNFVWIGSYELHYTTNKSDFLKISQNYSNKIPSTIENEEYSILSIDSNTCTVYGRFTTSTKIDENTVIYSRQRVTFVWNISSNKHSLLHLHTTMSRDIPVELYYADDIEDQNNIRWFDYMRKFDTSSFYSEHILLKDHMGNEHRLFPKEIFYVKSSHPYLTIHTANSSFTMRSSLTQFLADVPCLMQIHKSYLINPLYVRSIKRYTITLAKDIKLPIGKSRYNTVKELLKKHFKHHI